MKRRDLVLATVAVPMSGWMSQAMAQAWPDRPVKWVLSQPAGSGPDNVARMLADRLQKTWGQTVLIDNRPGGQNNIGAQAAARSTADGYTFYFGTTAALITNSLLFKQLPYDPQKDFVPVAFIARSPFAILVAASSPLKSIADLIARSKAQPGSLSLGHEGPRSFSGMIARLFNARTKAGANLVSYASIGVGVQDVIGGHVDALVAGVSAVAALVKQGRLRLLATTASKRVAGSEDVPALAETLPGFDMVGWLALVAPTGTPPAAIARASADVSQLLSDKAFHERIAALGPIAEPGWSAEQLGVFFREEQARWVQIANEIGLLPE